MKNRFKYILLLLSSLLVLQSAWAGYGVDRHLNPVVQHITTEVGHQPLMQTHQNMPSADACEEALDHMNPAHSANMVCEDGAACDMQFCAVSSVGLLAATAVFVLPYPYHGEKWAFEEHYRSQHYAPPVPPPLV